ncbi:hypothetical protein M3Y94_00328800 [Aphelenchoides besseyi]|nr:hypothetical protein M3Y94_00328800 [Aphelenchoides besseyi]KAI6235573.1 hypothetical protein M3Y95_00065800 [Aphelenchoides besseyi]
MSTAVYHLDRNHLKIMYRALLSMEWLGDYFTFFYNEQELFIKSSKEGTSMVGAIRFLPSFFLEINDFFKSMLGRSYCCVKADAFMHVIKAESSKKHLSTFTFRIQTDSPTMSICAYYNTECKREYAINQHNIRLSTTYHRKNTLDEIGFILLSPRYFMDIIELVGEATTLAFYGNSETFLMHVFDNKCAETGRSKLLTIIELTNLVHMDIPNKIQTIVDVDALYNICSLADYFGHSIEIYFVKRSSKMILSLNGQHFSATFSFLITKPSELFK